MSESDPPEPAASDTETAQAAAPEAATPEAATPEAATPEPAAAETLAQRLADGQLSAGAVRRLVRELDAALTRAHEAGLVHGHLGVERVVFDDDGFAQLSGLRAQPPEPAPGAPRPSRLEDQRALAALVYHALTGAAPPPTLTPADDGPRPVSQSRADVPRALDTVLARGMHRDPGSRYPDVAGFARAFEASFERLASPSRPMLALAMLGPLAILAIGILWAMSGDGDGGGPDKPQRAPAPVSRPAGGGAVDAGTR
ncbi:MAG: hypothetical protein IT370_17760 [Deltaproteobacteria bacterium]|nr:hypothetical protein [Deltaproteobacteria bacterium]